MPAAALTCEQELKLYLLANGVVIDAAAERVWTERFQGPLSLSEYASTSGICLSTPGGSYLNVPFLEAFTRHSEARFIFDGEFAILFQGQRVPVSVIPVPGFHHTTFDEDGVPRPYTSLGVTHTDRCRISPVEGCSWVCSFCDLPYEHRYKKRGMADLLRVIELAKDDPLAPARHVLISGGTPRVSDEPWIDEVYAFIAERSPLPVDVMMPARGDLSYPAWLRAAGVNMLSVNIEVWDVERARRIIPHKARVHGRDHYLRYIESAVDAFGIGFVQSLVVFGAAIEPIASSLEAVRALVERGCIPVLSPFRPDVTTPMGKRPPANADEMRAVYLETMEICEASGTGVKPGPRCVPCHHNTVAFPDGSDFYVPIGADLRRPIHG